MILLDDDQTLSAVRRSLEQHVLPRVEDEFARIQVMAAMLAIDEVLDRIRNGDPYEGVNPRLEARLGSLRAELGGPDTDPHDAALAEGLDAVLDAAAGIDDPRERFGALAAGLDRLVVGEGAGRSRLRQMMQEEAGLVASQDSVWLCGPAIESLQ